MKYKVGDYVGIYYGRIEGLEDKMKHPWHRWIPEVFSLFMVSVIVFITIYYQDISGFSATYGWFTSALGWDCARRWWNSADDWRDLSNRWRDLRLDEMRNT